MRSSFSDYLDPDSDLAHYGVKGMKWGVRKAENNVSTANANAEGGEGGGGGLIEDGDLQKDIDDLADLSRGDGSIVDAIDDFGKYYKAAGKVLVAHLDQKFVNFGRAIKDTIFGAPKGKEQEKRIKDDARRNYSKSINNAKISAYERSKKQRQLANSPGTVTRNRSSISSYS